MSFTRDWSLSIPIDHSKFIDIPGTVRNLRVDIADRIADWIYGFTAAETAIGLKYAPFVVQASAPSGVADKILVYGKDVGSKCELHVIDEDDNEIQLTSAGDFVAGMTGEVRMWAGTLAGVKTGWVLCDGGSGSPNLLEKMIKCVAAATEPGSTAGAATHDHGAATGGHSITVAEMPAHTHSYSGYPGGAGSGSYTYGYNQGYTARDTTSTGSGSAHTHTITAASSYPPYYELAFIYKI